MSTTPETMLRMAADSLRKEAAARQTAEERAQELEAKLASYERLGLAEECASMMVAAGTISSDDFLSKRAELARSREDLSQLKTAMIHYGPGRTAASSSVEVDQSKTASTPTPNAFLASVEAEFQQAMDGFLSDT